MRSPQSLFFTRLSNPSSLSCSSDPLPAFLSFSGCTPRPQCLSLMKDPEQNTVLKVWPHQCWIQKCDRLPTPAGYSFSDTSQGAVGHLGTLLTRVSCQLITPDSFLMHRFPSDLPQACSFCGVVMVETQDPALKSLLNLIQLASGQWSGLLESAVLAVSFTSQLPTHIYPLGKLSEKEKASMHHKFCLAIAKMSICCQHLTWLQI